MLFVGGLKQGQCAMFFSELLRPSKLIGHGCGLFTALLQFQGHEISTTLDLSLEKESSWYSPFSSEKHANSTQRLALWDVKQAKYCFNSCRHVRFDFFKVMNICMPACLFVQHLRAEKDIRYPETGVTGSCCESPRSVLGMEPRSSTRAANTELSLQDHVLIFF